MRRRPIHRIPVHHWVPTHHVVHHLAKAAVVALFSLPGLYNGAPVPPTQIAFGRTPDGFCVVGGAAELHGVIPDPSCAPVHTPDGGYRAP